MGCEHIRNLVSIDAAEIVAVADPNLKSRQLATRACGERFAPDVYEDYRDLLARQDVDAVVIASPNYTHIEVMRDLFETDKHVLLEKPMCTTVDDCREVVRRAGEHRGIVWVGLEYRYMAPVSRFIAEVGEGTVGDLKMFFVREHRYPFLRKVGDWNRFNRNTGGTLVEKCCHFFDMMNLVVRANPVSLFASGAQDVNHLDEQYAGEVPDILDNAYVIVNYDSGVRACLDLCMFSEGSEDEQELVATGNLGKLEARVPSGQFVLSGRQGGQVKRFSVELDARVREKGFHFGASYLEHLNFIEAIETGSAPAVTVEQGLMSVAMGVAAHRSIDEGRLVQMDEILR